MIEGELGGFLRSRRESVRPEDVGLPSGPRRRTPGLRRSELATLAGISVEYLTRLEQGRDRRPSTQVVAAIADALRLGDGDRVHLHHLVALSHGTELVCNDGGLGDVEVSPGLLALLDRLEPTPAYLVGRHCELLAWTESFDRLARPLGMLDGGANLIRYAFTDARARTALGDREAFADAQVAWLHEHRAGSGDVDDLVAELTELAGEDFSERWARKPIGVDAGVREFVHPDVGAVRMSLQTLAASDSLWLVAHLPADAASEAALDRLVGRHPVALRRVSS